MPQLRNFTRRSGKLPFNVLQKKKTIIIVFFIKTAKAIKIKSNDGHSESKFYYLEQRLDRALEVQEENEVVALKFASDRVDTELEPRDSQDAEREIKAFVKEQKSGKHSRTSLRH